MNRIFSSLLFLLPCAAQAGAQTGTAPADSGYSISIRMAFMNTGETFRFRLQGTSLTATINQANTAVAFPGKFPSGTAYRIVQTDGPRAAEFISQNFADTVRYNDIFIDVDGSLPNPNMVYVQGWFKAPAGITAVLKLNGKNSVTVKTPAATNSAISAAYFKFPVTIPRSSTYMITAQVPTGMKYVIASGNTTLGNNIPGTYNRIVISCDYGYEQVSKGEKPNEISTYYETSNPVIAGSMAEEGRYVAFVSNAAGLAGSTGKHRQIFLRDRNTGETILISKSANGEEGNGDSFAPTMNVNGHQLAFESFASNLVNNDLNGKRDIFLWEKHTPGLFRVSATPEGAEANGDSYEPSLSNAGEEIAFTSTASNLTPNVPDNYTPNVFLYDFNQKKFTLLSADRTTGKAVGGSRPFHGNFRHRVAFCSYASNLVADDRNGLWDIFLYEPGKPMIRISKPQGGGERNQGDESASRVVSPYVSMDGHWVSFTTTATNMVPDDHNKMQDAFEVNVESGAVFRLSLNSQGQEANGDCPIGQEERISLNYDGSLAVFSCKASNMGAPEYNIILHDRNTGETRAVTSIKGGSVGQPCISMIGNYVVFGTGEKLDPKTTSSGIFAAFTALNGSRLDYHYVYMDY